MPEYLSETIGEEPSSSSSTSYSNIQKLEGYRPIEITLTFRDGSKALPDALGAPQLGSIRPLGPEVLRAATNEETISRLGKTVSDTSQTRKEIATVPVQVFVTSERPILQGSRGAAIRLYWHDPNQTLPGSGDVAISPSKVIVYSQLGFVEVLEVNPPGKTDLVAYYLSEVSEKSARIPELEWQSIYADNPATSGFSAGFGLSQVYPVTRNKTDYLQGKSMQLRQPNLERSSPDYYPVFEYRIEADGSIQFSTPLHEFSDQPAKIEVRYKTLGIQPKLLINFRRDADPGISPEVPPLKIAVETLKT